MTAVKPPTIKDIAAHAGVSKSLVSRVLHDSPLVSEARRAAVLRSIDELGYRPNAAARTLVGRRSRAVAVLVTDVHNLFLPEVIDSLDGVLSARGYATLIVSGRGRRATEEQALQRVLELRVDGLVCAGARLGRAPLADAARATAVVNLTRSPRVARVDSVVNDDRAGAEQVVEHLVGLGHRRIAMIADTAERAGAARIRGYREAMAGRSLGDEIRVVPGGFDESGGHRAARALLSSPAPPTAIFAASDLGALGVLDAAARAGVDVPGRLSVVGYDNTPLSALGHIGLSTVDQAGPRIGAVAADALLSRIDHAERPARHVVIAPTLVARRTSGPAPAA